MESKLGATNNQAVKHVKSNKALGETKLPPEEQQPNSTYAIDTAILKRLLGDMLHDVQKIAELAKQSLQSTDNRKLRKSINDVTAELFDKLKSALPKHVIDTLESEINNCMKKLSPSSKLLIEAGRTHKLEETSVTESAKKDDSGKLSEDDRKANARLFSSMKMLEAAVQISKSGTAANASNSGSSNSQGLNSDALGKIVQQLVGDINSLLSDLNSIMEHFKNVLESQVTPHSMSMGSTNESHGSLGSSATTGASVQPPQPQVSISDPEDLYGLFKNMSMVAMMALIFESTDEAMVSAGAFFLQLSRQVQKLQSELAPTINLITALSSQMQALLAGYQGAAASNSSSPWQRATVLGFSTNLSGNTRDLGHDLAYGGYTVYIQNPTTSTTPPVNDDYPSLVSIFQAEKGNNYIANQIGEAYSSSQSSANAFPALPQNVSTIDALVDALKHPNRNRIDYLSAVSYVKNNPTLLNGILGNSPTDTTLNTGYLLPNIPLSLIDASGGAIISGGNIYPTDPNGNRVPGNWSLVTVSGLKSLISNLSSQMHTIQSIDNGSSGGSTDQSGMMYDSFNILSGAPTGLNNTTLNDFVSNTLNSAATTLGSTQQNLSQFGSKLVNEATQDILPLLQAAIQAFLKAFPS